MMTDPIAAMRDPNMSEASAVALYESGWWTLYIARDVALAQLKQERLCMPFEEFHAVVEQTIGGPVMTHEFLNMKALAPASRDPHATAGPPKENVLE